MKSCKNLFVKLICLTLVAVMCTFCFVACSTDSTDSSSTQTTTDTQAQAGPSGTDGEKLLTLFSDGKANVRVVYSTSDNSFAKDSAKEIADRLGELCGAEIAPVTESADDNVIEILVGATGCEESSSAMEALAPNSYSVTVSEGKIVVVANNILLYSEAIDGLFGAISKADGALTIKADFSDKSDSYPVISLAAGKKTDYTIIYENEGYDARTQAMALRDAFADAGVTISVATDTKSASGKEIIIGETTRPLSLSTKAYYFNSHLYCDENGNLAITGNYAAGVKAIIKYIGQLAQVGDTIDIPEFLLGFITPEGYGNAPKYIGAGEIKIVEGFEPVKCYYVQADGASEQDYKDYAKLLEQSGFWKHYSSQSQASRFSTYTDGYNIVNLSYIEYYSPSKQNELVTYVNIAIDSMEKSALPILEDNSETVTDIQVTQINSVNSFLVRLEDGRFLMIDGGLAANSGKNNADLIYNQIVAQNVLGGKPVIAAWLITHPHTDHVDAFYDFTQKYNTMVDLEMVICNLPNSEMDRVEQSNKVYNGTTIQYPNARFVVAHIGQRFAFAGLDLDILFTYENLYDASHIESSNLSSMVFSMEMPGGRMIITGDMYTQGCKIINAIYAEDLQCDVVQFCHHSYNGGDVEMYESMNAKVGIWSTNFEDATNRGLYGKISYNNIPVDSYKMHLIMSTSENYMVLREDMTKNDLVQFRKFEKK